MKFDFAFVKENPVAFGGIVIVGGLLLFMVYRNADDGAAVQAAAASGDTSAYDAQAMMVQADLAKANLTAQMQLAGLQAQNEGALALAKENNAAMIALRKDENASSYAATQLAAQTTIHEIDSNNVIRSAMIASDLTKDQGAREIQAMQISSSLQQFLAGTQAQVTIADLMAKQQIEITKSTNQTSVQLADISASVMRSAIKMQGQSNLYGFIGGLAGTAARAFF